MKEQLIGREKERKALQEYLSSERSEFIAVYGRRRVGKTFLIKQVIDTDASFTFTGAENVSLEEQLLNFYLCLQKYYPAAQRCETWIESFNQLERYLESLPNGNKIVFIDELPWLDNVRSGFVSALELFWNGWASHRTDIKLIVCGSAASWMLDNIVNDYGGLYHRVTHQILLQPFTLAESKQYFDAYGFSYSETNVAEAYMVLGGIPYYYSLMQQGLSVAQNIDQLVIAPTGELSNEMPLLFRSLFKHSDDYVRIIEALSQKSKGLTRSELLDATKMHNNARFTQMLQELETCGFIRCFQPYDGKKRQITYQLIDPFVHFYYQMVVKNGLRSAHQWEQMQNAPQFYTWAGLAFEMLCFNHIPQLLSALGITGIKTDVYSWRTPTIAEDGAQIDMVIDRADRCVNICEMKFTRGEYDIQKAEATKIQHRIDSFARYAEPSKTLLLTMITALGVKTNMYSSVVQKQITLHDLFQ